jgi:hypothetical protein
MKNFIKVLGIVLTAAAVLTLASCDLFEKGGTIEVTNGTSAVAIVTVSKELDSALDDPRTIQPGKTEKWTFEEDGTYIVTAALSGFIKPVFLSLGSTEKVTIE